MTTPVIKPLAGREMDEESFDEALREMERQIEATRLSERLTAEDYAVVINATSDDFDAAVEAPKGTEG
jgi:hypothetical protein